MSTEKTVVDEIFEKLGTLQADVSNVRETTTVMKSQVDTLVKSDVEQSMKLDATHNRLDKIEPVVAQHEAIKNKGIGIMTFASFLLGLIGSVVSRLLFGGHGA